MTKPADGITELEADLTALGGALDHPDGNGLLTRVSAGLGDRAPTDHDEVAARRRSRASKRVVAMLTAAAVVLAIVAIPSSRTAIANLFRSGGVELRNAKDFGHPKVNSTTTTMVPSPLEAAQRAVEFPVRLPQLVPIRTPSVTIDRSVPGGLVALDYGEFRVVEVAAGTSPPVIAKGLEPKTKIQAITVGGAPGVWITGTHHFVAYLDRDGNLRRDTVREEGHVLLWTNRGVTFRVEGFHQLAGARQVADSIP
ncbi:MAG: hypothetical protein ABIP21_01485 [Acidimicrobiia bacterium]